MRSFDSWIASKLSTSSSEFRAAATLPTFGLSARIACAIIKTEENSVHHDLGSVVATFWDEKPHPGYLSLVSQFLMDVQRAGPLHVGKVEYTNLASYLWKYLQRSNQSV
jgi:hypothetical protein